MKHQSHQSHSHSHGHSKSKDEKGAHRPSGRALWSGAITFGLVTIPVKLFTAVREKTLHFRSLHDQDHVPLKMKLYCPADGKDVHPEHIVKGYEIEKDHFVIVRQEELERAIPKATHAIEIQDFVDLDEIDPMFFDRPYYVMPSVEGAKPYLLLMNAMEQKGKIAIARVVMHNKQYLCALRPLDGVMVMETMHFADEVVPMGNMQVEGAHKVDERELKMASQLIDTLTGKFKPEKYHDEYREQVMEIIQRKANGEEIVTSPLPEEKPTKGKDLMAALEASLAKARGGGGSSSRDEEEEGGVATKAKTRKSHPGTTTRKKKK